MEPRFGLAILSGTFKMVGEVIFARLAAATLSILAKNRMRCLACRIELPFGALIAIQLVRRFSATLDTC